MNVLAMNVLAMDMLTMDILTTDMLTMDVPKSIGTNLLVLIHLYPSV